MGTAMAPSTALPSGSVLAGQEETRLRRSAPVRAVDVMQAHFGIGQRGPGEPVPEQDAHRVRRMRRLTRARLNYCGLSGMTDPVTLVVSELVTNAILHSGGTQVAFTMQLQDGLLYVSVGSDTPGKPAVREADSYAEHGRGLQLVECMVEGLDGTWGVSDDGTTVWCLFPVRGEGS